MRSLPLAALLALPAPCRAGAAARTEISVVKEADFAATEAELWESLSAAEKMVLELERYAKEYPSTPELEALSPLELQLYGRTALQLERLRDELRIYDKRRQAFEAVRLSQLLRKAKTMPKRQRSAVGARVASGAWAGPGFEPAVESVFDLRQFYTQAVQRLDRLENAAGFAHFAFAQELARRQASDRRRAQALAGAAALLLAALWLLRRWLASRRARAA